MANKPTADTPPADDGASGSVNGPFSGPFNGPVDGSAPAAAGQAMTAAPHPTVVASPSTQRNRWVLPSIAGVGLVILGLLGGILIGQHIGLQLADHRGPDAHVFIEREQPGQQQRLPERLRERWQDIRGGQQNPGQQNPGQQESGPQPSPSETPPGENG